MKKKIICAVESESCDIGIKKTSSERSQAEKRTRSNIQFVVHKYHVTGNCRGFTSRKYIDVAEDRRPETRFPICFRRMRGALV